MSLSTVILYFQVFVMNSHQVENCHNVVEVQLMGRMSLSTVILYFQVFVMNSHQVESCHNVVSLGEVCQAF
jgi:hypothetical protein